MSFLIDTDVCSAHLKIPGLLTTRFLQHMGRLHLSAITMSELYDWALRARSSPNRLLGLDGLLKDVTVLDVDLTVARKYGELQAAFRDVGRPAPEMDLLIASTALIHNLTLVTHNVAHFQRVPGLSMVDWLVP